MRKYAVLAIVASLLAGAVQPAAAAIYTVTNLDDSGPGSLREAITLANIGLALDDVVFQPGLVGVITLTSGEIAINDSVNIQGPGARILAVTSTARIFSIDAPGSTIDVTISGLTLFGASATSNGGAIANTGGETVTLRFVSVSGNQTTGEGGAIFNNGGQFIIENSTLAGNHANKAGAIYSIGFQLVIINSTISGNTATDSVGAVKLEFAFASISNSTISDNSAGFSQGGVLAGTGNNQLDLVSTIIANNTDSTGESDLARFAGTVNATDSLIEQALAPGVINGTDTNNQIEVDPDLRPLANNGGPTDTHALARNSPAIDAGSNPLGLPNDQRGPGFVRQYGVGVDIGAFELQPSLNAVPSLSALGLAGLAVGLLLVGMRPRRRADTV